MRVPHRVRMLLGAALVGCLTAVSGCAASEGDDRAAEGIVTRPVDPEFLHGTDRGPLDQLAAAVVTDVQGFWADRFPDTFGRPWHDLDGGFFSVDTTRREATPPPCTQQVADLEGNAYFCASVDAVAWDRAALLPVLREHYGESAVAVVLAHEMGHGVQHRTGVDITGTKTGEESTVIESMADCYAGSFLRWVVDGHAPHLRMSPGQLDGAMRALITFRDPIGNTTTDEHGTAFDRVSAFQHGYLDGAPRCAAMTPGNQHFTRDAFGSPRPRQHTLSESIDHAEADLNRFFGDLLAARGQRWEPLTVRSADEPNVGCAGAPGPVLYCPDPRAALFDPRALNRAHETIGDNAVPTLLASRFALAAQTTSEAPATGPDAARRSACLTGAYTASRLAEPSGRALSAADLDEAVDTVLTHDSIARDSDHRDPLSGFDRVNAFRTGVLHGPEQCGLRQPGNG